MATKRMSKADRARRKLNDAFNKRLNEGQKSSNKGKTGRGH